MVISKRLAGARYSVTQYAGAAVVAAGIIVAIGPSLAVGSGSGGEGQELLWSLVLVLSCIPMALSSVYKEMALGESELDPIYLNGCALFSGEEREGGVTEQSISRVDCSGALGCWFHVRRLMHFLVMDVPHRVKRHNSTRKDDLRGAIYY